MNIEESMNIENEELIKYAKLSTKNAQNEIPKIQEVQSSINMASSLSTKGSLNSMNSLDNMNKLGSLNSLGSLNTNENLLLLLNNNNNKDNNNSKDSLNKNNTYEKINNNMNTNNSNNFINTTKINTINNINLSNNSNNCNISSLNNARQIPRPAQKYFNVYFESKEDYIKSSGEYINEIYLNLLQDEKKKKIKPYYGYMNFQTEISEKMRAILIDWIIVNHNKFNLNSQTLFQTIWILDTYLSMRVVPLKQFQLLGLGCLLIACKSQETYYPKINLLLESTEYAFTKDDLLKMESNILNVLNYEILCPTAEEFYNIIAKAFGFNLKQYYCGKYFLESSLYDYQMIKYNPSVIAASCCYIVMKFFRIKSYDNLYSTHIILVECPQKAIKETARELCFLVKSLYTNTSYNSVKEKYSHDQYFNVVKYCEWKE